MRGSYVSDTDSEAHLLVTVTVITEQLQSIKTSFEHGLASYIKVKVATFYSIADE
jgi:hypothetical protein